MMNRLVDITQLFLYETDFEVHANREKSWDFATKKDFESRKETAKSLFRQERKGYDLFKIADVAKLPVMTVREIESDLQIKATQ
ncbi:hypothetical protein ACFOUV_02615 [Oceanobacillus longus]|uniref:Uncharacterized protein n=1 Tax=Oceanobacillus longus TaxID=930120 RepID=A0ABV8GX22_9BACI